MNKSQLQPKILIINGQSMYDNNATAVTLRSIFSQYDKDCLIEVFYSQVQNLQTVASHEIVSLQIPLKNIPLNMIIRKLIGQKRISRYNKTLPNIDIRSAEAHKSLRIRLKEIVLAFIDASPIINIDKNILRKIDHFSPNIIYTMGAGILPLKLALCFSNRYHKIPILLHYMDNWVETKYRSGLIFRPFYTRLQNLLKKVQRRGNCALVISQKMADYYNQLFKPIQHYPLMNSVEPFRIDSGFKKSETGTITFVYAGGLHLNRDRQLLAIQNAIAQINTKRGKHCAKLLIFTSDLNREKYENCFTSSVTEFRPFVEHERIYIVYNSADVLVHIESFDKDLIEFTKFSLSTKISEYMLSGKPILCYAPPDLALFKYVCDTKSGLCASDEAELNRNIEALIDSPDLREKLGKAGIATALKNHSSDSACETILMACKKLLDP